MAGTIRVEKAALRRIAEANRHVECPDCQTLLCPVTDRPAHNAAAMQIEDDGEVGPPFGRPDIGDVTRPLLVGCSSDKIAVQPIGRDAQTVMLSVLTLCLWGRTGLIPFTPVIRAFRPRNRRPTR